MPLPNALWPVLAGGVSMLAGPALADLTFCNESGVRATVSIGYSQDGVWTSEGWWTVEDGACRAVVSGDLPKRYYYWRATAKAGAFAGGGYGFCTDSQPFTISGDEDCEARGYDSGQFREEDIGEATDHTVTLRKEDAPKDTARKKAPSRDTARRAAPEPVTPEDLGPGTFGEPLSIVAEFRGCWATQEVLECEFHADGWRYIASEEGPTDPGIIEALGVFSDGMRLQVSGDLISYAGDRADIMIRNIEAAPMQAPASSVPMDGLMDHIQGYWDSDDGSGYGWLVEGNRLKEIYDANISEEYVIELHPDCAASGGRGPVIIGWPQYDPSMGPACFLVTETAQRHLAVENVVEGTRHSFSYSN